MFFEIAGALTGIETFAVGRSTRERARLRRLYGRGRWRKRKGFAEVRVGKWYAIRRLSMPQAKLSGNRRFAVCLRNAGYKASLEFRKLDEVVPDPEAEAGGLIRIIDESGDDYLYPADSFRPLDLPSALERALRMAS